MLHKHHASEEFPYTENQLACALGLLCRYPQLLCKDLAEVDNITPEKVLYDESTLLQKNKNLEIEKKQQDAFEEALTRLAQSHPEEDTDSLQSQKAEEVSMSGENISLHS